MNAIRPLRLSLLFIVLLAACGKSSAAGIIWTNIAGGNWNLAANWNPNQVPGASDTAIITNAGTYSVTLDISPTVSGFTLGTSSGTSTQTFLINGQNFTISTNGIVNTHGVLNLNGGRLTGTYTVAGILNWTAGFMFGPGVATIATNGTLVMNCAPYDEVVNNNVINAGTTIFKSGDFYVESGSTFTNLATAVFDVQGDLPMHFGGNLFVNSGTFRKSAGSGDAIISPPFINSGTMDAQTGSIVFYGGSGTFNSGSTFTGAGTTRLTANGLFTMNGSIVSSNLVLEGATVTGTYTLVGTMTWESGNLNGPGVATIATNGTLFINSPNGSYVEVKNSNTVVNAGTVILTNADFYLENGSVFTNLAGALFDVRSDHALPNGGASCIFYNSGTFRKSAGTGSTSVQAPFVNNGTIDAQIGAIAFNGGGGTFNAGTLFTGVGAARLTGNSYVFNGSIVSSNLVLEGATITGTYTLVGTLNFTSGYMNGPGVVTIATNGTLLLNGPSYTLVEGGNIMVNAGTVIWTNGDFYLGAGAIFTNIPGALFDVKNNAGLWVEGGGTNIFYNLGTFRKSAGSGSTTILSDFINSGTIEAQTGTISFNTGSGTFNVGTSFIGAGSVQLAAGNYKMNGNINCQNFSVAGGGLTGTYSIAGTFNFNGGFMDGPGTATIATNGILIFNNPSFTEVRNGNKLINAGTVILASGDFYLEFQSAFTNLAGALFDVRGNGNILPFGTGPNFFANRGTFRKSAGANDGVGIGISFINDGVVSGEFGTFTFASTTFTNPTGTIAVSGGTLQFTDPLVLPAGRMTGKGTIVAPSITSVGAIVSPGAITNILAISGNYTQQIGGSMEFDLGGIVPGVNQSQVNVSGAANLNGTIGLRFSDGYSPAVGGSNIVLTAGSRSGQFRFQNYFFLLGQNKRMTAIYNPANVVVSTLSAADPANVSLSAGVSGQTFAAAWPAEFTGYSLYQKTNLISEAWMLIPGVTNLYIENPMNADQKYFQLIHN